MSCSWFRERYSDFADGLLDEAVEVEVRHHLAHCPACRQLDAAYRLGVGALRHLPEISTPRGFQRRLADRLGRNRAQAIRQRQLSGIAASLCLVAAVGAYFHWGSAEATGSTAAPLPIPASVVPSPFAVPAADDSSVSYPYHFSVMPFPRDPRVTPATPAVSFAAAAFGIAP